MDVELYWIETSGLTVKIEMSLVDSQYCLLDFDISHKWTFLYWSDDDGMK